MEVLIIFPVMILLVVSIRLAMDPMDRQRIRDHISERGGTVLNITWSPFGRGWFGEQSQRIYEVRYLDAEDNEHAAFCKTSIMTGVYWTEDRIINASYQPEPVDETARLRRENALLREEIERLRRN